MSVTFTGGYYDPLLETIYDSYRAMLDSLGHTDVQVIYSNYNVLEPATTYCVLSPIRIEQVGKRDEGSLIELTSETIETSTHFKVLLQSMFVGNNAGSVSTNAHHTLRNRRIGFDEFNKRNLSILNQTDLRRNPQLRETQWVDAFAFDVNLTFSLFTRYTYDWVEYISVNGEVYKIPYNENP